MSCCSSCSASSAVGAVVGPANVHQSKELLDAYVRTLDDSVYACEALTPEERAAWSRWYIAWDKFLHTEEGFWTAGAEADHFNQYERTFKEWESKISKTCRLLGASYSSTTEQPTAPLVTAITWLAVGTGILGVAWFANSAASAAGSVKAIVGGVKGRK